MLSTIPQHSDMKREASDAFDESLESYGIESQNHRGGMDASSVSAISELISPNATSLGLISPLE